MFLWSFVGSIRFLICSSFHIKDIDALHVSHVLRGISPRCSWSWGRITGALCLQIANVYLPLMCESPDDRS